MAGLRERKKEQARQRIAAVALRLFAERGFEAVTVNEIASAAEVAKATLFKYFPSKESLVLQGVADDDLAGVISGRPAGQPIVDALRGHLLGLASEPGPDPAETVRRVQIISASPALRDRVIGLIYKQRQALAAALAAEFEGLTAWLIAAQISAVVQTLQERFIEDLSSGVPVTALCDRLTRDVEVALDLLHHGINLAEGRR